ncbi:MAG: sulfite exporter TauE/SafE family protein [Candidatus Cloacimonetes bacterium]|nr:sulfite exporter TauE/SafE family protein [Candidatus Cloacimonadota bacterium]
MYFIFLFLSGLAAGFINTLAGGGSVLVLPVLILAGLPSPIANATNRVAILLQNITGSYRFHAYKKLEIKPVIHIALAAIVGSIAGSLFAVRIDSALFDKILGIIFIFILLLILRSKKNHTRVRANLPRWIEILIFLGVGFYGGFIQVGVGFIFLATLNLIEDFDLVRANAVKVFIVMCYTFFAVLIFTINGMIIWKYGLILALGNILGAFIGVRTAVKKGETVIKVVLAVAIIAACMKLFGVFSLIGLE